MFEELTTDDVALALDEVVALLGVSEEVPCQDLVEFVRRNDAQGCVQGIADRLRLPIRISLSYVSRDSVDGFRTTALAQTGGGTQGITAQVEMPQSLPMFGTSGLEGYLVRVRASENCDRQPAVFITIMLHELSHVLLATLLSPRKDSELHTDLVPIALGFRDILRQGRKVSRSTQIGNQIHTATTTYGYLTDHQFDFACDRVAGMLKSHRAAKSRLEGLVARTQLSLRATTSMLEELHRCLEYLDGHPVQKMRQDDARRVVQMHAGDYGKDWESGIMSARASAEEAKEATRAVSCYTRGVVERMQESVRELELSCDELGPVHETIAQDVRLLRRYLPTFLRLRSWVAVTCRRFLLRCLPMFQRLRSWVAMTRGM